MPRVGLLGSPTNTFALSGVLCLRATILHSLSAAFAPRVAGRHSAYIATSRARRGFGRLVCVAINLCVAWKDKERGCHARMRL